MSQPHFIVCCTEAEVARERVGYVEALKRLGRVSVLPIVEVGPTHLRAADGTLVPFTDDTSLWFIDPPVTEIPSGLPKTGLRSVIIHLDSDCATDWRLIWSRVFSMSVLCCSNANLSILPPVPKVIGVPYAARREWFNFTEGARDLQIGWVGTTNSTLYTERLRLLPLMAARYRMNDWKARVPENEVVDLYRRSEIIVNIQRDDFLLSYNIRCFEAMAAGCLLFVRHGSSLKNTGLVPGIHYETYDTDDDLFRKLDYYLANPAERERIAGAGKQKCQEELTYDSQCRVILNELNSIPREQLEKTGPLPRHVFAYLHYLSKRTKPFRAFPYFLKLAATGSGETPAGALVLLKSFVNLMRSFAR